MAAGVASGGVGTVVGLSLTAAGAAVGGPALGAATGAATHFIAMDYEELEDELKGVDSNIKDMRSCADAMDKELVTVNAQIETVNEHLEMVNEAFEANYDNEPLFSALDALLFHFKTLNMERMDSILFELRSKCDFYIQDVVVQ